MTKSGGWLEERRHCTAAVLIRRFCGSSLTPPLTPPPHPPVLPPTYRSSIALVCTTTSRAVCDL